MAAIGKRSPLSLAKGGARTACEMVKGIDLLALAST